MGRFSRNTLTQLLDVLPEEPNSPNGHASSAVQKQEESTKPTKVENGISKTTVVAKSSLRNPWSASHDPIALAQPFVLWESDVPVKVLYLCTILMAFTFNVITVIQLLERDTPWERDGYELGKLEDIIFMTSLTFSCISVILTTAFLFLPLTSDVEEFGIERRQFVLAILPVNQFTITLTIFLIASNTSGDILPASIATSIVLHTYIWLAYNVQPKMWFALACAFVSLLAACVSARIVAQLSDILVTSQMFQFSDAVVAALVACALFTMHCFRMEQNVKLEVRGLLMESIGEGNQEENDQLQEVVRQLEQEKKHMQDALERTKSDRRELKEMLGHETSERGDDDGEAQLTRRWSGISIAINGEEIDPADFDAPSRETFDIYKINFDKKSKCFIVQ